MNKENLEFLKAGLERTGFADYLNGELERHVRSGALQFTMKHEAEYPGGRMKYELLFKHGRDLDMYYFNKYEACLTKADGREFNHTFHMIAGEGFSAIQAYNLLDGRAAYKQCVNFDGDDSHAWFMIDFERKGQDGNNRFREFHQYYNVTTELLKLPLADTSREFTGRIIQSLQRGDLQAIDLEINGALERRFIAADPELKGLKMYDQTLKEITTEIKNSRQLPGRVDELTKNRIGQSKGLRL